MSEMPSRGAQARQSPSYPNPGKHKGRSSSVRSSSHSCHTAATVSTITAASTPSSFEEICQHYEAVLSQLAEQVVAQEGEIRALRRQLEQQATHRADSARRRREETKAFVYRVSEAVAQEYLDASDTYLAECMARRLRRITRAHVRRSIDNATAKELHRAAVPRQPTPPPPLPTSGSPLASPNVSVIERERSSMVGQSAEADTTRSASESVSDRSSSSSDDDDDDGGRQSVGTATEKGKRSSSGTLPYVSTAREAMGDSGSFSRITRDSQVTLDTSRGEDAMRYLLDVFSGIESSEGSSVLPRGHSHVDAGEEEAVRRRKVMAGDSTLRCRTVGEGSNNGSSSLSSSAATGTERSHSGVVAPVPRPTPIPASAAWEEVQLGKGGERQTLSEDLDYLIGVFSRGVRA